MLSSLLEDRLKVGFIHSCTLHLAENKEFLEMELDSESAESPWRPFLAWHLGNGLVLPVLPHSQSRSACSPTFWMFLTQLLIEPSSSSSVYTTSCWKKSKSLFPWSLTHFTGEVASGMLVSLMTAHLSTQLTNFVPVKQRFHLSGCGLLLTTADSSATMNYNPDSSPPPYLLNSLLYNISSQTETFNPVGKLLKTERWKLGSRLLSEQPGGRGRQSLS